MNFWWVSQNQTWNQEISGGYMWSPQLTSDGKNIFHYENMLLVKKGDIVLSYYDQKIQALGIITSEAYDFPKPLEFRSAGDDWNTDGWKVDVTYKDLITIEEAFKSIDSIKISKDHTKKFINGVKFKYQEVQRDCIKVYSEDNRFLGLGEINKSHLKHKQLV